MSEIHNTDFFFNEGSKFLFQFFWLRSLPLFSYAWFVDIQSMRLLGLDKKFCHSENSGLWEYTGEVVGIVIDEEGRVLTIGYLILEAGKVV